MGKVEIIHCNANSLNHNTIIKGPRKRKGTVRHSLPIVGIEMPTFFVLCLVMPNLSILDIEMSTFFLGIVTSILPIIDIETPTTFAFPRYYGAYFIYQW